ncbi:hypothetical protein EDB89DRAFT_1902435 [Lactarius sanguifluus]|nr:hypothetical protein EDB89DRAFT_1902435 [Lactarius sanguifluus]
MAQHTLLWELPTLLFMRAFALSPQSWAVEVYTRVAGFPPFLAHAGLTSKTPLVVILVTTIAPALPRVDLVLLSEKICSSRSQHARQAELVVKRAKERLGNVPGKSKDVCGVAVTHARVTLRGGRRGSRVCECAVRAEGPLVFDGVVAGIKSRIKQQNGTRVTKGQWQGTLVNSWQQATNGI